MKVANIVLEINRTPVASMSEEVIKKLVLLDMAENGLTEKDFESVVVYVNVENGEANAYYTAGTNKGIIKLEKDS